MAQGVAAEDGEGRRALDPLLEQRGALLPPALPGVDDAELAREHGEARGEMALAGAATPALEQRPGGGERAPRELGEAQRNVGGGHAPRMIDRLAQPYRFQRPGLRAVAIAPRPQRVDEPAQ